MLVDVTGVTKGKGFQGVIKRQGQSRGPMAHGSRYHRRPGSMGPLLRTAYLNKRNYLVKWVTELLQSKTLEIVKVDVERNFCLLKE